MQHNIRLWCDAACENREGQKRSSLMGIGVYAKIITNGNEVEIRRTFNYGIGTNNIGEWLGLVEGFRLLNDVFDLQDISDQYVVKIYLDSQLICYQFNGSYKVKKDTLRPYFKLCRKLFDNLNSMRKADISVIWLPREQNIVADKLSKLAFEKKIEKFIF